jgi:hypothetical protein
LAQSSDIARSSSKDAGVKVKSTPWQMGEMYIKSGGLKKKRSNAGMLNGQVLDHCLLKRCRRGSKLLSKLNWRFEYRRRSRGVNPQIHLPEPFTE